MKRKWLYIVILVSILLSFLYDKRIALLIIHNRVNLVDGFMIWLTNLLTTITIFLLMTTLFLWEEKKREWIIPLWLSIGITAAVTIFIKIIVSRARPFEALMLPLIQGAKYTFAAWNTSFPSLHTAAAFSLVPILDKEFPKLKWFWVILALLIAFSRLYIGVHYLSDVLAGCLIGLLIGFGVLHLEKKYKVFKKWKKKKS